ncbi:uncharacterized protein A4U43_C05F5480 [Asparagus officinalis]|uniref:Uncharacterized protein n=1 Tax=Asparagus officinalis TaxID=4686 RepID=A0A5P1EQ61_ASPOF|nr:uncharacterized protein A4U43_C05F5480 [Asparagus officinalis]
MAEMMMMKPEGSGSGSESGGARDPMAEMMMKPKHRYSNSIDGSSMMNSSAMGGGGGGEGGSFEEVMEAKKAMTAEQLAELAAVDPKKAKSCHKFCDGVNVDELMTFINEWDRGSEFSQKVLRNCDICLFAMGDVICATLVRDTTGLGAENAELKIRLQAMEQQAQLRDALNEALKQEVDRLKVATGEAVNHSENYNTGLHQMPYNPSFFSLTHQQQPYRHQEFIQMQQSFNLSNSQMLNHSRAFSELMQQDPLRRSLQGLDISKVSPAVKSETPSISASESSSNM